MSVVTKAGSRDQSDRGGGGIWLFRNRRPTHLPGGVGPGEPNWKKKGVWKGSTGPVRRGRTTQNEKKGIQTFRHRAESPKSSLIKIRGEGEGKRGSRLAFFKGRVGDSGKGGEETHPRGTIQSFSALAPKKGGHFISTILPRSDGDRWGELQTSYRSKQYPKKVRRRSSLVCGGYCGRGRPAAGTEGGGKINGLKLQELGCHIGISYR